MDEMNLYTKYDINGEEIFFLDKACTRPYTGKIEKFFKGVLNCEADVVEGFLDGVCIWYYDNTDLIESISQMKHNLTTGLAIEFFKNGRVNTIALFIREGSVDSIIYDENGKIDKEEYWDKEKNNFYHFSTDADVEMIKKLREKYDLRKINEEIMREGKNFDYKKYFGL